MLTKKFHTFLCPQAISFWTSLRYQRNSLLAATNQITSSAFKPPIEFQCKKFFSITTRDFTQNNKANTSDIKVEAHKEKVELKDSPAPEGTYSLRNFLI